MPDHWEKICNALPVFGFNSAKCGLKWKKSYLLPLLVNKRGIEPVLIRKSNKFVSSRFENVQLLVILNFLGGATILDFFLKAYKTWETKGNFHMKGSMMQKSSTKFNIFLTKPPLAYSATTIFSIKIFRCSKFESWGFDIWGSILETEIEAFSCNWTTKRSIFDQCMATKKTCYLTGLSAPV